MKNNSMAESAFFGFFDGVSNMRNKWLTMCTVHTYRISHIRTHKKQPVDILILKDSEKDRNIERHNAFNDFFPFFLLLRILLWSPSMQCIWFDLIWLDFEKIKQKIMCHDNTLPSVGRDKKTPKSSWNRYHEFHFIISWTNLVRYISQNETESCRSHPLFSLLNDEIHSNMI